MKTILVLLILATTFSCKQTEKKSNQNQLNKVEITHIQSNNNLNDSVKPNYQYTDLYKMRNDIINGLKGKGYKIPLTDFFRKRILEVSGIDITEGEFDDPDFGKYRTLAIVLRDINVLLPVDIETYAKVDDEYLDHIINYNNMVIYDQMTAVLLLDKFGQNCNVYSYIAGTGYTGNDKFLKKALEWVESDKRTRLTELLLGGTGQPNIIPTGPFRFDMLKKIEKLKPGLMSHFYYQDFSKYKLEKNEENKALAYIINSQVSCKTDDEGVYIGEFGVSGLVDDYLWSHPVYLNILKENNYYGFEKLKQYVTVIFVPEGEER